MKPLDLVGQKFGKLTVIEKAGSNGVNTLFKCQCDCGNIKTIVGVDIKKGHYVSCGCVHPRLKTKMYREHPLYDVWKGMKARCYDKKHRSYSLYGAIGVTVCEEWRTNFLPFYEWAISNGWSNGLQIDKDIIPKKLSIAPILYSPTMCCWVTSSDNNRNRKNTKLTIELVLEIRASNLSINELAVKYNVHKSHISKIKRNVKWKT